MKKNIKVIVDTREQNPLNFENYPNIEVYRDKLDCGDYTIFGHDLPGDDYSIMIERKRDTIELLGNLGRNWDRFVNELELLSRYKVKYLLIGGPNITPELYESGFTKLSPNFVRSRLLTIQVKYGIPVYFLSSEAHMEEFVYSLFKKVVQLTEEEH